MLYISHLYTFIILELFLSMRILEKTPKLFFKYTDKQSIDIIDKMPNSNKLTTFSGFGLFPATFFAVKIFSSLKS